MTYCSLDPKYWLPSVLKCVLNVSKLSSDKDLLRQTFTDIVRHRIKNTGNRKPQLVTTDFDVAEDMLSRGWDLVTSFSIRYKHLLLSHPRGKIETDEDIDHILDVGDDDYEPIIDDSDDEEMNEVIDNDTEDRKEVNDTSEPGPNYFHVGEVLTEQGAYILSQHRDIRTRYPRCLLQRRKNRSSLRRRKRRRSRLPTSPKALSPRLTPAPSLPLELCLIRISSVHMESHLQAIVRMVPSKQWAIAYSRSSSIWRLPRLSTDARLPSPAAYEGLSTSTPDVPMDGIWSILRLRTTGSKQR